MEINDINLVRPVGQKAQYTRTSKGVGDIVNQNYDWYDTSQMSNALRILVVDMIENAKSGHPGLPLGMADTVTVLYQHFMRFNPRHPKWSERDRFVLSAGHGSALLYCLLYMLGYPEATVDELRQFRTLSGKMAGHPEYGSLPGIEATTGPLGQGIANAVGMSINGKLLEARQQNYNSYKTYVLAGDGCLMEGISYEALSLAGHLKLNNLVLLFDDNGISIDGPTNLTISENQLMKFQSLGWAPRVIDGHDYQSIYDGLAWAQEQELPCVLIVKTVIGYGAPSKSGTAMAHGSPLGAQEAAELRRFLGFDNVPPFVTPPHIMQMWRSISDRWPDDIATEENNKIQIPTNLPDIPDISKPEATRQSFGRIIDEYSKFLPFLLGGSADLTPSNNTSGKNHISINPHDFTGNYIHYGVREHAMAAIMNGIALCGNFIPYGGTFLAFTDYMRPAIRMAALMQTRVIFIATHDSVWLGEDGPTHQPIEHLASLRVIPGLRVFRPCNAAETKICLDDALNYDGPSILVLSRQTLSQEVPNPQKKSPKITIYASGSEVELAMQVAKTLELQENIEVNVMSVPELAALQIKSSDSLNVVIEAGMRAGWDEKISKIDLFVGINQFGHSGRIEELKEYFGFTVSSIIENIKNILLINGL